MTTSERPAAAIDRTPVDALLDRVEKEMQDDLVPAEIFNSEDVFRAEMERIFRESLGATLLPKEAIEGYFEGWKMVEPGVVPLSLWRPDDPAPYGPDEIPLSHTALVGGVAHT